MSSLSTLGLAKRHYHPHMSGDTEGHLDDLGRLFVDNLTLHCSGEPLLNVVDKSLGFVPST